MRRKRRHSDDRLAELDVRLRAVEDLIREDIRLRQYENIYLLRHAIKRTRASMGLGM